MNATRQPNFAFVGASPVSHPRRGSTVAVAVAVASASAITVAVANVGTVTSAVAIANAVVIAVPGVVAVALLVCHPRRGSAFVVAIVFVIAVTGAFCPCRCF
jgi:hypothetical protein